MRRSKATSTPDRRGARSGTRRTPHPSPGRADRRISRPLFTFVGGKGGVGKTTCAAAMGVLAARSGERTLLISSDPAPSLADALGQRLGPAPRAVRGVRGLHAVEVAAAYALDRWLESRREALEAIALRGTWLDREDVSRLLRLSLPGIDEIAALLQIDDFGREGRYTRIIVDAAPTGHLLRMLAMPAVLEGVAQVFDHMQAKHRIMVDALRGGWTPDEADALIAEIDRQAQGIAALLRDPARARLWWVTLAEAMAVEETADALAWLRRESLTVERIVVNRLTTRPPQPCGWCRARRHLERKALDLLQSRAGTAKLPLATIPAVTVEPRGIAALTRIGRLLEQPPRAEVPERGRMPARTTAALPLARSRRAAAPVESRATRLLMFGGKGGVGKTTCACAAALAAAAGPPRRRVLLLSADPAHSVGDALGIAVSDKARRVPAAPGRLMVREIDAARAFAGLRERFVAAIDDLFRRASGGADIAPTDRQVLRDLIDLAPPGIDELVAIVEVTDSLIAASPRSPYDLVVMDTAPTGHALRLIEMPGLVHDWVKTVMSIMLKYQAVVGVGELGAVLLRLSQGLGRLREMLADPDQTRFVAVTRAAVLPRHETMRLLERLTAAGIHVPAVVVNAVGTGTCSRCRADGEAQRREIAKLLQALRRGPASVERVDLAPAELPPPHGPARLRGWRKRWVGQALSTS